MFYSTQMCFILHKGILFYKYVLYSTQTNIFLSYKEKHDKLARTCGCMLATLLHWNWNSFTCTLAWRRYLKNATSWGFRNSRAFPCAPSPLAVLPTRWMYSCNKDISVSNMFYYCLITPSASQKFTIMASRNDSSCLVSHSASCRHFHA